MPLDMDVQTILLTEMAYLISKGQHIQAIKLYRERTGIDLADAQMVVDRIELKMRASGFYPAHLKVAQTPNMTCRDRGCVALGTTKVQVELRNERRKGHFWDEECVGHSERGA